jgi:hypothetical protein
MTFQVVHSQAAGNARSPFRIVEQPMGREVEWVNHFLDREYVRCLAAATLRGYAMDLLHFLRWWAGVNQTDAVSETALASALPDYVRFQAGQQPRPAPATINRRVIVVGCALRNEFPDAACTSAPGFSPLLLVAFVAGLRPFPSGAKPLPREGAKTHPHASFDGSGRAIPVGLPHRA